MGEGKVSPFCVFVYVVEEVFYSHLGGSVPYGREPQAHLFGWSLYPLRGKLCSMLVTRRSALLRMRSISVSCGSVRTPRCVAWYLDLRSCSITRFCMVG